MKLTDSHLVLLIKAAQHEDKLLTRPDALSDKAAQSLATRLIRAGFIEEKPLWHVDDENGPVGLRITAAGLSALGLDPDESASAQDSATADQPRSGTPRPGTKQALILDLLSREEGASLDDLIAATGWLPHTTRAALTGLRQRGHTLAKSKGEDGRTRYRIANAAPRCGRQLHAPVGKHISLAVCPARGDHDADLVGALVLLSGGAGRVEGHDDPLQGGNRATFERARDRHEGEPEE